MATKKKLTIAELAKKRKKKLDLGYQMKGKFREKAPETHDKNMPKDRWSKKTREYFASRKREK